VPDHDQQLGGTGRAEQRDVGGQRLAECTAVGVEHEGFDRGAAGGGGVQEFAPGLGVAA